MNISLKAEEIFRIGNWPVTNALLMSFLSLAILTLIFFAIKKSLKPVPGRIQGGAEVLMEGILGLMDGVLHNREESEKYMPLVATIFLFVLTSNWMGILPGVGTIGFYERGAGGDIFVPYFRSAASDLNFTLAMAIMAVLAANVFGVAAMGFFKYGGKFFTVKKPFPISTFVGLLELISEFAKIVSFSFRLFGNVFAGEVLLTIIAFLVPVFVPLPFLFLEIFVGFIQALVFAMLTLVFIGGATASH